MKKHFIAFIALIFVAQMMWAGDVTPSTTLTTYYASIDGTSTNSSDDLRKTLCTVISTGYVSTGYSSLPEKMYGASTDPTDFVNGTGSNKTMEDIYSSKAYTMRDAGSSAKDCGAGWNKEHTVPQSWFNKQSPMVSDAFHVYPTDIHMNSLRSSYPYGETDAPKGCANYGYGRKGNSTFPGYSGIVFDPGEGGEHGSYKGDLARTYFYMATRYRTTNFTSGSGGTSFTYSSGVADLTSYMRDLMLKWHREDPVSEKELKRNNAVYAHQKNRNPYIDYPELVEYIWGTKKGEVVVLAALVSAYDGETPPPGPQPEVPKYGVTWSVNGEELYVDSVAQNTPISVLPAMPVSCSTESNTFVGWTTAAIDGIADEAPATLYLTLQDFPAVTADVTYYAVFAKAETVEYGPQLGEVEFVFTQTVASVEQDGVKIVFGKGTSGNSPRYYETGEAIRCYGGNTITVTADHITAIQFTFGSGDGSNAITPNTGTFRTDTWTGEADEVMFTIGGTSGHRRIHAMKVTRDGISDGTIYSRFITSCQTETEVELLPTDEPARKMLIGGQIYILLGEQLFNLQGQRIK